MGRRRPEGGTGSRSEQIAADLQLLYVPRLYALLIIASWGALLMYGIGNTAVLVASIAAMVGAALLSRRAVSNQQAALGRLLGYSYATSGDIEALLMDAPYWADCEALVALMADLLDELEPGELQNLRTEHVRKLHECIAIIDRMSESPPRMREKEAGKRLCLSALRVLAAIGDTATMDAIDTMRKRERDGAILDASWEAHGQITRRLQRPPNTLLRPADATGDTLLRPASGDAHPDAETLVRPVDRGE